MLDSSTPSREPQGLTTFEDGAGRRFESKRKKFRIRNERAGTSVRTGRQMFSW